MNDAHEFHAGDLKQLCDFRGEHLLSLYLPTERAGAQLPQNRLRLKSHVEAAEAELRGQGVDVRRIREQLGPLVSRLDDAEFWKASSDGLAALVAPQHTWLWRLAVPFREFRWIGPRFALKPLAALADEGEFLAIAVSGHGTQLYRGNRWQMAPVQADLPRGLPETLDYTPVDGSRQSHGAASAVFHGQGGQRDAAKDEWQNYFRIIDEALWPHVRDSQAPLVFVGVDYLFPLYREVNRYPRLAATAVGGNPASFAPHELAKRVREAAFPAGNVTRHRDVDVLEKHRGSPRATSELVDAVQAADEGRVDAAFVALDIERWGRCAGQPPAVLRHAERQSDSEDLLDRVVVSTLRAGGRVYVEPCAELPDAEPVSALLRYS